MALTILCCCAPVNVGLAAAIFGKKVVPVVAVGAVAAMEITVGICGVLPEIGMIGEDGVPAGLTVYCKSF